MLCPTDWTKLSFNPSLTVQDVLENVDRPWHPSGISVVLDLTVQDLCQLQGRLDWTALSRNPHLCLETVVNTAYMPWNWNELSCHRFKA